MRKRLMAGVALFGALACQGDEISGPNRTTILKAPWGSLCYEPGAAGASRLEPFSEGFRVRSGEGEVVIRTTGAFGTRLEWGKEALTLTPRHGDLEIRGPGQAWKLTFRHGNLTLAAPGDTVVFSRNANTFTIKGSLGEVSVSTGFTTLRVQSPLGVTTAAEDSGRRTFTGPALDTIPYLGRGVSIPFHGVWVFLDVAALFPMPEVAAFVEWKPILRP